MNNNEIHQHVRRVVGIATLRRLRRMVDSDTKSEAEKSRWARLLGMLLAAITVIFVAGLAFMTTRGH